MKEVMYEVEFRVGVEGEGPYIHVLARSRYEAKILAMAERIKKGQSLEVEAVREIVA